MIDILKGTIEDYMNELHTSLPCTIQSVDHGKGTCVVQPIPKRELCGELVNYPPLIDVRLDFLKFGDWKFQIPRKQGDIVWIGFSETTISEVTSLERFSLNEPYIIGSCEAGYEGNSEDIILTGKGTRIEIKGDGSVVITTGSNNMTINSNLTLNGDLTHKGNTTQTGNLLVVGNVGASVDVSGGGISLKGHTHSYKPGEGLPTKTGTPS